MSTLSDVMSAALTLSHSERAQVARELLLSLERADFDDDTDVEQAWAEEIQERLKEMREGRAEMRNWDEVYADIRRSLVAQREETGGA
jgi:hypothetical protein